MFLFFLDESGNSNVPFKNGIRKYFCRGGVILDGAGWRKIANEFFELKRKPPYNIPPETEVKWNHLRSHKGPLGHLGRQIRDKFRNELFSWLGQLDSITVIGVRFDKERAVKEKWYINTTEDVQRYSFQFLVERFHLFLEQRSKEGHPRPYGVVVQDPRGRQEDAPLRNFYRNLGFYGTYFVQFTRLVEALLLVPSEWSVGVQLADFCVGAIRRKYVLGDGEDYDKIHGRVRRGPPPDGNEWRGYGVVFFP